MYVFKICKYVLPLITFLDPLFLYITKANSLCIFRNIIIDTKAVKVKTSTLQAGNIPTDLVMAQKTCEYPNYYVKASVIMKCLNLQCYRTTVISFVFSFPGIQLHY